MMGNAAIQAAERARELLADAVVDASSRCRRIGWCSPSGRVFDAEDPETRRDASRRRSCLAEATFGTHRHDRLVHAAALAPRSSRAAASARRRPTRTPRRSSRSRSIRETGWIHVPRVWIAHDIGRALNPTLVARPGRGQRLHGPRRSADGGAGVPPPAAAAVARARAQVPVDARVQEPDDARHAGGRHRARSRIPIPHGPFGAKEVGQGPLLPIMPAVANAVYDAVGVRDRRGADHAGEDPEGAARRRRRASRARYGPARFPTIAWPEPLRAAAVGRRRRQGVATTPSDGARRSGGRGVEAVRVMMRLPRFRYRAPRTRARRRRRCSPERRPSAMLVAGGTDLLPNMKRRQQTPRDAHRPARRRASCARIDERRRRHDRRRRDADRARAPIDALRAARTRAVAGGRAGRDAAPAQHGHARRQPVPRHALQLLRPELRVAQGDRLLHEEGRRDLLGGDVEPEVPGGVVDRHGAGAASRSARA